MIDSEHRKYREDLAAFMLRNGFATGHGDTFHDLLNELEYQVRELTEKNKTMNTSPQKNGVGP